MQIQTSKQNFTLQFKALHIANAGEIGLYKIVDAADKKFVKNLPDRIKISELMPNLSKQESDRWQEMLEYAAYHSQFDENTTYISTHNNKPCGIITFRLAPGTSVLDCICTFPTIVGQKVKLAGKTLFYQLFKDFLENNGSRLELEAITNGPINVMQKYQALGFKPTSTVLPTKTVMTSNKYSVKEAFKKLTEHIDYNSVKPQKVNLMQTLD